MIVERILIHSVHTQYSIYFRMVALEGRRFRRRGFDLGDVITYGAIFVAPSEVFCLVFVGLPDICLRNLQIN